MNKSYLERECETMLTAVGIDDFKREYQFHPERKWRLDFAWPAERVGLEIDGGVFGRGGHHRYTGVKRDAEKAEALLRDDWLLYRVPGFWIVQRGRRVWRPEIVDTIRLMLERRRSGRAWWCECS